MSVTTNPLMGDVPEGSYGWWRKNYATNPEYQKILGVLGTFGYDVSETEVDHFPPDSTYASFYKDVPYDRKPAFPLIKPLHQPSKGQSYGGGYATSSKSSGLAKTYRKSLGEALSKDDGTLGDVKAYFAADTSGFFGAMKQDLIDKKNLAFHATSKGGSTQRNLFNPVLRPAVMLAFRLQLVSETECLALLSEVYD